MAKLEELMDNEEFLNKLAETKTDEEAIKLFKDNGADVTEENIKEMKANLNEALKDVPQDVLEEVSGGRRFGVHVSGEINDDHAMNLMAGAMIGGSLGMTVGLFKNINDLKKNYNWRKHGNRRIDAIKYGLGKVALGTAKWTAAGTVAGTAAAGIANTISFDNGKRSTNAGRNAKALVRYNNPEIMD